MKRLPARVSHQVSKMRVVLGSTFAFCALLALSGCNSGALLALLLLGDDDGGGGALTAQPSVGPVDVQIVDARNARTRPAETELTFRLTSDDNVPSSSVRVEFAVPGEEGFRPATLTGGAGVVEEDPGLVAGLEADPGGRAHTVVWDALGDLDQGGRLALATVRVTTGSALSDQRDFLIGNDPPEILDVTFDELGGGDVDVTFRLADSSLDLVDVTVEYAISLDDAAAFAPATVEGEVERLSSAEGNEHSITWKSAVDLGNVDRTVQVRVSPRDRLEGSPAAEGDPFVDTLVLDSNASPAVELREEFLLDADSRRGQALAFLVSDADGDPVDLVVQWAIPGLDFPELPPELDEDTALRESLLTDPDGRRARQIITLRPERIEGRVEEPAPELVLDAGEILATWIRREAELRGLRGLAGGGGVLPATLAGSRVELVAAALPPQSRAACAYDPATGILRVSEPFDPPPIPGDLLRVEIGGALLLGSSPEGRVHRRIWDSRADLPGGGPVRLRVTPYDRAADLGPAALGGGAGLCFASGEFSPENAVPASRGPASPPGDEKTLDGPFGLRSPLLRSFDPAAVPAAVTSADIDGDERLDIVAVVRSPDMLVVSRQTAPGIFDPDDELRLLDARMGSPRDVAVADIDGDDDLDVAVAADGEKAGVMLFMNEDLDFVTNRVPLRRDDLVEPSSVIAADVDGDEDIDLVVGDGSADGPRAVVFYGGSPSGAPCAAGDGEAWTACPVAGEGSVLDLAVADVDGDDRPDLVLGAPGGLSVALQTTSGGFEVAASADVSVPGAVFDSIEVSDIDGDEAVDLVALDVAGGRVVGAFQGPAMQFTPEDLIVSLVAPVDLVVEDIDQNGERDLVIADAGTPGQPQDAAIVVCLSTGDFYSSSIIQRTSGGESAAPRAVATRDIDGDGALDIVSADDATHELAVHLQDVAGRFSAPARELAAGMERPRALAAADIDGDGRIDLAVPSLPAREVTFLLQPAEGPWQSVNVALPAELDARGPIAVALADVDGDGRADLATANVDSDSVAILYQSEDGSFGSRAVELVVDGALDAPETVELADIDGDGRLDVVSAGRISNDVLWFRQRADGTFDDGVTVGGGAALAGPISLVATDLDGDGRTDLAIAGHRSENIVLLYQGASAGEFDTASEVELPAGTFPVQVVAGERDAEGVVTLAVVSLGAAPVARLVWRGPRAYDVSTLVEDPTVAATAVAAADVDVDGSVDIVWADADEIDPSIRLLMTTAGGEPSGTERVLRSDTVSAPAGILVFDLDGDGEPDIISANRESGNVTVFHGGR